MTNICAGAPPTCTLNDVVDGLAQLSVMIHGLGLFLVAFALLTSCAMFTLAVLMFARMRT